MLEAIVSVFDRVTSRPGLRSSLLAILVFLFVGFCLLAYELTTAQFRLQRLTQTAELVRSLQQIEEAGLSNPGIATIHKSLQRELTALVPHDDRMIIGARPPRISARETLWKFLAGGAFWWLIALFAFRAVLRREEAAMTGFIGLLVFGVVFGAIGAAIPTAYWPWFNLLLYPLGHFGLVLLLIAGFGMDLARARGASVAAEHT